MTPSEALRLIGDLTLAFPQRDISEDAARLYAQHLEPYSQEAGRAAVARWVATEHFFPTPAALRELCRSFTPDAFDPGRNMSPATDSEREPFTEADQGLVQELLGRYWGEGTPEGEARRFAARMGNDRATPEERDAAARKYATALPEIAAEAERDLSEAHAKFRRLGEELTRHPHASPCSGERIVIKDGHHVCTHCGQCVHPDHVDSDQQPTEEVKT